MSDLCSFFYLSGQKHACIINITQLIGLASYTMLGHNLMGHVKYMKQSKRIKVVLESYPKVSRYVVEGRLITTLSCIFGPNNKGC